MRKRPSKKEAAVLLSAFCKLYTWSHLFTGIDSKVLGFVIVTFAFATGQELPPNCNYFEEERKMLLRIIRSAEAGMRKWG